MKHRGSLKAGLRLAVLLLAPALAAAQYKWVDPAGRVSYGDSPPRDAQKVERFNAAVPDGDPRATLPYELRRAAESFPVQLFTTADCAACRAGRELLAARAVPFEELTVTTQADIELMRSRGYGDLLPVVTIGRNALRQFNTEQWNRALDAAGYPRGVQLPRGWLNPPPRPATAPAQPAPLQAAGQPSAVEPPLAR